MSVPSWNEIPYDQTASPSEKADQFDRQYVENMNAGTTKESLGQDRPEPKGGGHPK